MFEKKLKELMAQIKKPKKTKVPITSCRVIPIILKTETYFVCSAKRVYTAFPIRQAALQCGHNPTA